MKRLAVFAVLVATVFGAACTTTPIVPRHQSALVIQMPAPGKSKVVFIRPRENKRYELTYSVHDDDRLIGELASGYFFQFECEPGYHWFSTSMEDVAMLEATLLPDRIYYVRVSAAMGWVVPQVDMYSL